MIEAYIACVAGTYAVWIAQYALQRTPRVSRTYHVYSTWTGKTHTTKCYRDAWDWVAQYRNVECEVFINGDPAR